MATWKELSTATFEVDEKQLQTLIEDLKFILFFDVLNSPTSHYIKVERRRWIAHLLQEVSLFRKRFGLGARLPKMCAQTTDWPLDLEDKDDLSSSMTATFYGQCLTK